MTRALLASVLLLSACDWFTFDGSRYQCADSGSEGNCPLEAPVCVDGYCTNPEASGTCGLIGAPTGQCAQLCNSCVDNCCTGLVCVTVQGVPSCHVPVGGTCSQSSDCASSLCSDGACACSGFDDACATTADCCNGLECADSTCRHTSGQGCNSSLDCTSSTCSNGTCL